MHPRDAEAWSWDDANERELASHRIAPWEVEQLFVEDPVWVPNKKTGSGEWKMVGYTRGGRPLAVVVTMRDAAIRPITGWDATPGEKTKYLTKRRRST